jgi:hypothetical protein
LSGSKNTAVLGDDADNVLLGNDGANIVVGQGGDDVLSGAGGDDEIYGGAGDDVLAGGEGADRLYGAGGDDRYEIGGLQDGVVDWIEDDAGANIVDMDHADPAQMSFGMDGGDAYLSVFKGNEEVLRVADFEAPDATFDFEVGDTSVPHAALAAAVEELRAAHPDGEPVPLHDVLAGYLGEGDAVAAARVDPLADFMPEPDETAAPTAAAPAGAGAAEEPGATFVTPDGTAGSTTAAAAGMASKPAAEEEPAYA